MKVTYLDNDQIIVPPYVERKIDRVEDDKIRKSMEATGIHQPFVVCPHEGQILLIDGLTRSRIARVLQLEKVPTVADPLPDGMDLERHICRTRFIVNHHRQDLLPSQEAEVIEYFKREPFNMTHREIAKHLGMAPDSVTNALAIKNYLPAIAKAVDAGQLTRQAARVFDGLSETGMQRIWKEHHKALISTPGGILHAQLRQRYSPEKHPDFYRQPELIAQRLNRKGKTRKGQKRPDISTQEKIRLLTTTEFEEAELRGCQLEAERLDRRRNSALLPVAAILRNEELCALVPPDMLDELKAWAAIYL